MTPSLLTTKFYPPTVPTKWVKRPRLSERLTEGLEAGQRMTLVSASAGYGKTSVVSAWLSQSFGGHYAWLSLDQYDDDPNRFWQYVLAALQNTVPGIGDATRQLLSTIPLPPPPTLLTGLLNDLASLPHPIILVLDDYHYIADPVIHVGLDYLIAQAPSQLHLVLITRADPPISLARLRARGQLMELRQHHLQFSAKEAKQLLNESIELALSKQDIELLEQRTEGWVTGLQLTAISLQGRADTTEFIERFTGSHHYILEYLAEEVLLQQPDFVQAFLLQTSILERLSGTLCDVVTGRDDSHAILDQLHQQNLFITTLDDDRQWFRYHHLMVDLLANRLRQTTPNDEIQLLHQRASVWCKKHGSWETAISHAVQAASWERAADLVFEAYHPLFSQGRIATWQRWLEQLPYPTIQANLPLRTRQAWATFLNGQVRQAEMMLEETRQSLLFLDPTPENLALRGELATYLANIAFLDEESSTIIEMAEEALVYLPPEQVVARARATGALGLGVSLTGDTRKAMGLFHETVGLARWAGNPFFLAHSLEVVADSQYHTGQLHAAADTCREIIALGSNDRSTPLPFAGNGQIKLAGIYVEWHELEKAGEHLEKGLVLSRQEGVGYNALQDYCIQVRLFQAVGNDVKALEALRRAEDIYRTTKSRIMAVQLAACEVQHWLKAGDVVRAVSWAEGRPLMGDPIYLQALPIIGQEVQEVSLAKIHLAQGHSEAVLDIYDQICDQAQMAGRMARVIEISLLKALALQAMGDPHAALAPLRQCLVLAEPEGYVRLFLDAGVETVQLLRLARAHGIAVDYVEGLLDVFRASNLLPTSVSRALPESLTPRELQVLQLIGAGYSNQQIAEELIITLNTVKKHSSHIYEKLAVQGRTQAVARAHEIGLIEPKVHTPE